MRRLLSTLALGLLGTGCTEVAVIDTSAPRDDLGRIQLTLGTSAEAWVHGAEVGGGSDAFACAPEDLLTPDDEGVVTAVPTRTFKAIADQGAPVDALVFRLEPRRLGYVTLYARCRGADIGELRLHVVEPCP